MNVGLKYARAMYLVGATCLTASLSAPAYAQEHADRAASEELGEIVVTATKRPTLLRDTPIAVTVVGSGELAERHATQVSDLAASIPNVFMSESNAATTAPVIRGITSNTRNAGVESGVSVYVDGVYTGRPETFNQALGDAASVEVLQGPQGSLFGKNSIAGAISVVTTAPAFDLTGRVSGGISNFGGREATGMINIPLADELAALRVTGFFERDDGYVKNLTGGPNLQARNSLGGRAKLLLTPSSTFKITIAGDYNREHARPNFGENLAGVAPTAPPPKPVIAPGPFTVNNDVNNRLYRTISGVSVTLDADIGGDFRVTSITAYRHNKYGYVADNDSSPRDEISVDFRDSQSQFSQELRLVSPVSKPLKFVAGLYYFSQDSTTAHAGVLGTQFVIPGLVPGGRTNRVTPNGTVDTRSYAAYIDGSYDVFDGVTLFGGLRVTYEKKHAVFGVTVDPQIAPLFYAIPTQPGDQDQTDFSPTLGLRVKLAERANVYAKVSRGYKSGGWNLDFSSRTAAPTPTLNDLKFSPEKVTNYEVGLKGEFFDRHLRINASAYYMDYTNLQVTQFFGLSGGAVTSNAASAKIKGASLETTAVISSKFSIGGSAGYNHARYGRYANVNAAGASADGNRLPGPSWTLEGHVNADLPVPSELGTLAFWGQISYRSNLINDPLNRAALLVPARTIGNASLTYTSPDKRYSASLWARNIFNKTYYDSVLFDQFAYRGTSELVAVYAQPRTYGFTLTANF